MEWIFSWIHDRRSTRNSQREIYWRTQCSTCESCWWEWGWDANQCF